MLVYAYHAFNTRQLKDFLSRLCLPLCAPEGELSVAASPQPTAAASATATSQSTAIADAAASPDVPHQTPGHALLVDSMDADLSSDDAKAEVTAAKPDDNSKIGRLLLQLRTVLAGKTVTDHQLKDAINYISRPQAVQASLLPGAGSGSRMRAQIGIQVIPYHAHHTWSRCKISCSKPRFKG